MNLTKKKYGLIWEEHEERVDKELETQIPTFEEIKDKEIMCNPNENITTFYQKEIIFTVYIYQKKLIKKRQI